MLGRSRPRPTDDPLTGPRLQTSFLSRLAGLFRSKSDLTTLRQLEKAGVRSVNVLDLARLEQLVGEAMETALREALSAGGSAELAAGGAQVEFLRRLGLRERLADHGRELAQQSAALSGQVAELESALERSRGELKRRRERDLAAARTRSREALDLLLRDSFAALRTETAGDREDSVRAIGRQEELLRAALLALLDETQRTAATLPEAATASGADDHDAVELDRLERRVRKLTAQRLESQELLARTQAAQTSPASTPATGRRAAAPGSDAADQSARKSLLAAIFEHNLELRRTLADHRSVPPPAPPGPSGEGTR
jgi:hypothetical protein